MEQIKDRKYMCKLLGVCENTFVARYLNPLLSIRKRTGFNIGVIPKKTPTRIQYSFLPSKFLDAVQLLDQENIENNNMEQLQCQSKMNIQNLSLGENIIGSKIMLTGSDSVYQLRQLLG